MADFSAETLLVGWEWHNIFKVLEEKGLYIKNTLPSRVTIQMKERKSLSEKHQLSIHDHEASLTRNVKGTSLWGKYKAIRRGEKVMKTRNFTGHKKQKAKVDHHLKASMQVKRQK